MELILTVRSFCGQPVDHPMQRTYQTFPVVVGRSACCDYVLRDANMYISSNHAKINTDGNLLLLTDKSANGTYINTLDNLVGKDNTVELNTEDILYIGEYCVHVSIKSHDRLSTGNTFDGINQALAKQAPEPTVKNPFDPFDDSDEIWIPQIQREPEDGSLDLNLREQPDQQASEQLWLPEDSPIGSPGPDGHYQAQNLDNEPDNDDWADVFSPELPEQVDNAYTPLSHPPANQPVDDTLGWLPGTGDVTTEINSDTSFPDLAEANSAEPLPRSPDADLSVPQHLANSGQSDLSADLEQFLQAAKVDSRLIPAHEKAQLLRRAGHITHVLVNGIRQLLHGRKELKDAIRGDVTQLGGTDNNPLKFSPNTPDALAKLLVSEAPGYQSPDRAIKEAVNDLNLHQVAMIEGMKTSVESVLLKFDPAKLAEKLQEDRPISANIPVKREAELWNLFCEHYREIRDEAVDDFGELFQREFRSAYAAHLARARSNSKI